MPGVDLLPDQTGFLLHAAGIARIFLRRYYDKRQCRFCHKVCVYLLWRPSANRR
jgi:hypothetical protein